MRTLHPVNLTLFGVFLISLAVMMLIVYNDTDSKYDMVIVISCLVYFFLYVGYVTIIALLKTIRMNRDEKKARILKFLAWFLVLSVVDIATSFVTSSEIRSEDFFVPFGMAIGIAFFDVMFFKKRRYS
ncbi:hypothetical protein [Guptibacillus hwajinpoensis]|uniref:Uncharacterized protein n=1 Tax=Guptibacillus hwajinpoensis TaxID=208199 RepID=A0A0J6D160_9BACL|nr:hypothetical protein [Alkalihalobacillus macyae]KMM37999.1 hypothetical protein AB986_01325 [Alkalihalobacillus macyae]